MSDALTKLIQERMSTKSQGRVVSVSALSVTVSVGGRTMQMARSDATAFRPGDRVNMSGNQIIGKRKPPPVGAVREI